MDNKTFALNLDEEFQNAKIEFPSIIPVTVNFDNARVIGTAKITQNKDLLEARISCENSPDLSSFSFAVAGTIGTIRNGKITNFKLSSVSLVPNFPSSDTEAWGIFKEVIK